MFTPRKKGNEINDGIDSAFFFPPYALDLLDTAEVQRTHSITQNGFSSVSFPNLRHSRKVHLIGTTKNALKMWGWAHKSGNVKLDHDSYEAVIASAAMLHDIGHAPFSHNLENLINTYHKETHEQVAARIAAGEYSLQEFFREKIPNEIIPQRQRDAILRRLEKIPSVKEVLEAHDVNPEEVAQIIDKTRASKYGDRIQKRLFLREFIDGKIIDADKLDYLVRDAKNAGISELSFNPDSLIASLGIVDYNNQYRLAVRDSAIELIHQLLKTRAYMYTGVYTHKTVLKVQAMIYESAKRFLKSLDDTKRQQYGNALHLLDEAQFETLITAQSEDPIASDLFLTARYDRRAKYDFAYVIKNNEIPIALDKDVDNKREILRKIYAIDGQFPEDSIRDKILAHSNAANGKKLENHEIIVYLPHPRKISTEEDIYSKFDLILFDKDDSTVYHAAERLKNTQNYNESLHRTVRAFAAHQTSHYFLVLTPKENVQRVKKATEEYIKELLQ